MIDVKMVKFDDVNVDSSAELTSATVVITLIILVDCKP